MKQGGRGIKRGWEAEKGISKGSGGRRKRKKIIARLRARAGSMNRGERGRGRGDGGKLNEREVKNYIPLKREGGSRIVREKVREHDNKMEGKVVIWNEGRGVG